MYKQVKLYIQVCFMTTNNKFDQMIQESFRDLTKHSRARPYPAVPLLQFNQISDSRDY